MVMQVVSLQPMKDHVGINILSADCEGRHRAAAGGCALKEAATWGEPMQGQAPGKSCSPWGPTLEQTNNFPQVKSVLPMIVLGKSFPCLYLNSQAL